MPDYYDILGVNRGANKDEIKKAYRQMALKYHPDRNPGDAGAEQKFKEAAEAYDVLNDDSKRSQYDQFGSVGVNGGGTPGFDFDLSDALRTFMSGFGSFGGFEDMFGGGRGQMRASRGGDLRVTLHLTFEEIAAGVEKTIRVKRFEACSTCNGSGAAGGREIRCPQCRGAGEIRQVQRTMLGQVMNVQPCHNCGGTGRVVEQPCRSCHGDGRIKKSKEIRIDVPSGVAAGNYMTLSGEGNHGRRGAPPGDLIVLFDEEPHDLFMRHGRDVLITVHITFAEAALGTAIKVPTLDGSAKLKFPAGIQSGHILRMRDKGFPGLRGRGKGDQLVKIQVTSPAGLSNNDIKLYEDLMEKEPVILEKDRYSRFEL
ncbi:MAG: molecular chaperone DnaJ [Candidatus Marinimicrobia bacterium]|nr:molecular chaperone DnaJ [Candidatus Neomarinimicrobiota bacterium]